MKILKKYPAIFYGVTGIVAWTIKAGLNLQYDNPGIQGVMFWIVQLLVIPYWLVSEFIFVLNHGEAIPFQWLVSVILGFLLCIFVDYVLLRRFRIYLKHKKNSG